MQAIYSKIFNVTRNYDVVVHDHPNYILLHNTQIMNGESVVAIIFVFITLIYVWLKTTEAIHVTLQKNFESKNKQKRVVGIKEDVDNITFANEQKHEQRQEQENENDDINRSDDEFSSAEINRKESLEFLERSIGWYATFIGYGMVIMNFIFMAALSVFAWIIGLLKCKSDVESTESEHLAMKTIKTYDIDSIRKSKIVKLVMYFTSDAKISFGLGFVITIFLSMYTWYIVPKEDGYTEEPLHMHVDIMMFVVLLLSIFFLAYSAYLKYSC